MDPFNLRIMLSSSSLAGVGAGAELGNTGHIRKNAPPILLNFSAYKYARRLGHISCKRWDPWLHL